MLQFVNPALLIGAALLAVPLIIHLLNRQRFRRRRWAAMEFLLAAYRKQRRRLRRENLLLLLLRCLIPVVLALAIARPLLRDDAALGSESGPTHHVLVFDQSYSMNLQLQGGGTPFERAKSLAGRLLDRIGGSEANDRVSLVVAGLRPVADPRETVDIERAKARVAALLPPIDAGPDLIGALSLAAELVEASSDAQQRVYLFTDLQLRAFGDGLVAPDERATPGGPTPGTESGEPGTTPAGTGTPPQGGEPPALFATTAPEALRRLGERARLTIFDVRGGTGEGGVEPNVQVTGLELAQGHALRNVAVPVIATVRNRAAAARDVQVTLTVDDGQPIRKRVRVDAGAEAQVDFETSFQELGDRRLQLATDGDDLPNDDQRFAVVRVRERIRVLVVENDAAAERELRESTHVVEILDPTGGEGPPDLTWFDPVVVDKIAFLSGRVQPADFDLVVLANLSALGGQDIADALTDAVRAGTGLFAMLGAGVDDTSYNVGLYRGGRGPMPMAVESDDGRGRGFAPGGDSNYGTRVERRDHPVFRDFNEDVWIELLESVPIYRYLGTDRTTLAALRRADDAAETEPGTPPSAPPPGDASAPADETLAPRGEVLLSVRDASESPLLVASRYGAGKALFLLSPISRKPDRWNRLDTSFAGLTFMLLWPAAQWLTLPAIDERNVLAGSALSTTVRERPTNLSIVPPERAGVPQFAVGGEATPVPGDRFALPPDRRTGYAGFYVYEMTLGEERGSALERRELFAVNPDPAEGDLDYLSHARAAELLGVERIVADLPESADSAVDAGIDELGPLLLWATLAFLIGEAAMARFVSRRRT
ncbi:MAG: BatA domain-containing protein [Planctomycetes bacterium]|nr:BatA domain-containing protein [Planctomycetota bacterium]